MRPILNAEGHKRWSLGFAIQTLLEREQKNAHTALGDAEETCDLMRKCLKENQTIKKKAKRDHLKEGSRIDYSFENKSQLLKLGFSPHQTLILKYH